MASLDHRSVLVTGARGFIGRMTCVRLKEAGARVVGTCRTSGDPCDDTFVSLDLTDTRAYSKLDDYKPFDAIVHCAAHLPTGGNDVEMLIANQKMAYYVGKWAIRNRVPHIVFTSSCSVYGYSNGRKNERTLPAPENIYAVSKLASEQLLYAPTDSNHITICILRIAAPYGSFQRAETVLTTFLRRAAEGQPLILMGSGKRSQDFVYQTDVARSIELAVARQAGGVFNIGGGGSVSMKKLAEQSLRLFRRNPEDLIGFNGVDPQENYRGRFSIESAGRYLGYRPEVALEEGLRRTARSWGLL